MNAKLGFYQETWPGIEHRPLAKLSATLTITLECFWCNIWEYKVDNNAIIANFAHLWKLE